MAALRTLVLNPFVRTLELAACNLDDSAAPALAELIRHTRSLTSLNLERNDLRAEGLVPIVQALRGQSTLRELKLNNQKFTVHTCVEEELMDVLHTTRSNTTLTKLGLVIRNDVPRHRIEAVLAENVDAIRRARSSERGRERDGERSDGTAAAGGSGECGGVVEAAPAVALGQLIARSSTAPRRRAARVHACAHAPPSPANRAPPAR